MDKEDVVYIYNGILSYKKEWNNAIIILILNEVSQKEKEKYHITEYVESKICTKWNVSIKTEADTQTQRTDLWFPREGGCGKGGFSVWD